MSIEVWGAYVLTVLALMSTPGPSQLLMLSNSATNGLKRGLFTAAGDLTANFFQMLAAGLGLAALVATSASALSVVKWGGVAYLAYLGLRMLLKTRSQSNIATAPARRRALYWQGFVTSAANPKAVVFFAALFPQFIQANLPFWPQFTVLAATYLLLDGMFLSAYGAGAGWLGTRLRGRARLWLDRIGGGVLIGAAVLLCLKSLRPTAT